MNIDYHVELEGHFASVPHQLAHELVEIRYSLRVVEIFHDNQRVASHRRSFKRGVHTTVPEHMPKSHRKHLEWSPSPRAASVDTPKPAIRGRVKTGQRTTSGTGVGLA